MTHGKLSPRQDPRAACADSFDVEDEGACVRCRCGHHARAEARSLTRLTWKGEPIDRVASATDIEFDLKLRARSSPHSQPRAANLRARGSVMLDRARRRSHSPPAEVMFKVSVWQREFLRNKDPKQSDTGLRELPRPGIDER